jgi:hypothetical protein
MLRLNIHEVYSETTLKNILIFAAELAGKHFLTFELV